MSAASDLNTFSLSCFSAFFPGVVSFTRLNRKIKIKLKIYAREDMLLAEAGNMRRVINTVLWRCRKSPRCRARNLPAACLENPGIIIDAVVSLVQAL
jgi:hypothetical protein